MSVSFTRTSDATLVPPNNFTRTSDAYISAGPTVALTSDATLARQVTLTSDAIITSPTTFTITSDAVLLQRTGTLNPTSDAELIVVNPLPPPTPPPPVIIHDPSDPNNATIIGRFPCDQHIDCPGTDSPVANYSAEAPDPVRFIGSNFGPLVFPPLGSLFTSLGCLATCYSALSQQDAENCAETQAVLCTASHWFPPPPPGHLPCPFPPCTSTPVYFSEEAYCDGFCPDGSPFRYVVPRGTFVSFSQLQADREALSYACRQVQQVKVCLSNLSQSEACAGQPTVITITARGTDPRPVNLWTLIAGNFPPGMNFSLGLAGSVATLSGTPTTAGSYTFTIKVITPDGNYMQKEFTLCVIAISPPGSTLPAGNTDDDYSETLTATSCASGSLEWLVTDGALPDGLDLDPDTGEISGTPTKVGTFTFTVQVTTQAT